MRARSRVLTRRRSCACGARRVQDDEELGSINLDLLADSTCLKGDLKLDVPNGTFSREVGEQGSGKRRCSGWYKSVALHSARIGLRERRWHRVV